MSVEQNFFKSKDRPEQGRKTGNPEESLEHYEISKEDLDAFWNNAFFIFEYNLLNEETLKGLRIVTFDSKYFYVITSEEHRSRENFIVEELRRDERGLRLYRINHEGRLGTKEDDYRVARAWLETPELEKTAINSTKVLNPKIYEKEKRTKFSRLFLFLH